MKFLFSYILLIFFAVSVFSSEAANTDKDFPKIPEKTAIMLAAFGTSVPSGRKAYKCFEQQLKAQYPNIPVYWAYTSSIVRRKLKGKIKSPAETLANMQKDGIKNIAVQSLHVFEGDEYYELKQSVEQFTKKNRNTIKLSLSKPLLVSYQDITECAEALLKYTSDFDKNHGIVFMGHGNHNGTGDTVMLALHEWLQKLNPKAALATVSSEFNLEKIKPVLKKNRVEKIYLVPAMVVAGEHAANDLAGNEGDSWKNILEKENYECSVVLKGMGENAAVNKIFLRHLKTALFKLNK